MPRWNCKQIEYIKQIFTRITRWRRLYTRRREKWIILVCYSFALNPSTYLSLLQNLLCNSSSENSWPKIILVKAYGSSLAYLIIPHPMIFCFSSSSSLSPLQIEYTFVEVSILMHSHCFQSISHSFCFVLSRFRSASFVEFGEKSVDQKEWHFDWKTRSKVKIFSSRMANASHENHRKIKLADIFCLVFIRLKCSMKYPLNHLQNEFRMNVLNKNWIVRVCSCEL